MMPRLPSGRWYAIALPTSLLLLAAWLRIGGLARDQRLHPDEALYGDLARRVGVWGDWQLTGVPVDKPPLFFFTGGLTYRLLGVSEFTTRLPNAFASLLFIAIVMALTRRLADPQASLWAGLLMALSPFDIAFAISGFTDTQALLYLMLSFSLLLYGCWGGSGLAFGVSLAVKPIGIWFAPLVAVWMGLIFYQHQAKRSYRPFLRWGIGVGVILLLVMAWDAVSGVGSFWALGQQHYQGGRWSPMAEWPTRLEEWGALAQYLLPHWGMALVGLGFVGATLRSPLRNRKYFFSISLLGMGIAYFCLHWWMNFHIFEQYLLPLVPIIAIGSGLGMAWASRGLPRYALAIYLVTAGLLLLSIPTLQEARLGHLPIASDEGEHGGIDQLAEVMNTQFKGQIFYERWLGWELRYYLGTDPQVILLYFETPSDLIAYAQEELPQINAPRYFVGPVEKIDAWVTAIEAANIYANLVYDDGRYAIYQLVAHP